jgi:hypothetical protein
MAKSRFLDNPNASTWERDALAENLVDGAANARARSVIMATENAPLGNFREPVAEVFDYGSVRVIGIDKREVDGAVGKASRRIPGVLLKDFNSRGVTQTSHVIAENGRNVASGGFAVTRIAEVGLPRIHGIHSILIRSAHIQNGGYRPALPDTDLHYDAGTDALN